MHESRLVVFPTKDVSQSKTENENGLASKRGIHVLFRFGVFLVSLLFPFLSVVWFVYFCLFLVFLTMVDLEDHSAPDLTYDTFW